MLRGEGFYSISYTGVTGDSGVGLLAFETGKIFGVDLARTQYLGEYRLEQGTIEATVDLTIPPGVSLVTGLPASAETQVVTLKLSVPRRGGVVTMTTSQGPIKIILEKIGDFPS